MKRRQGWFFLMMLTLVMTIGIPSCGGEDYAAIRDIRQVIIFDPEMHQPLLSPASTSSDTLILIVSNEIDFFSYHKMNVPGTMSEAWAFRPANSWMANEITDIRVFCNQPIYGQPAHQNLADQLTFGNAFDFQLSLGMFLESLPDIRDDYDFTVNDFQIFLNTKPEKGTYIFTIEMEDNNGHVFVANTIPVEWL